MEEQLYRCSCGSGITTTYEERRRRGQAAAAVIMMGMVSNDGDDDLLRLLSPWSLGVVVVVVGERGMRGAGMIQEEEMMNDEACRR